MTLYKTFYLEIIAYEKTAHKRIIHNRHTHSHAVCKLTINMTEFKMIGQKRLYGK